MVVVHVSHPENSRGGIDFENTPTVINWFKSISCIGLFFVCQSVFGLSLKPPTPDPQEYPMTKVQGPMISYEFFVCFQRLTFIENKRHVISSEKNAIQPLSSCSKYALIFV